MVSSIKMLKIFPKLFAFGKNIDLPVERMTLQPPFALEEAFTSTNMEEGYKMLLTYQLEDQERYQRVLSAELILISKQKQNIQVQLAILKQKKRGSLKPEMHQSLA